MTDGEAELVSQPPMDDARPQLWMTVSDVFHIKGRGTVITGQLEGDGQLNLGDAVVCDGMRWQVGGIEMFRASLLAAEPGMNIGVLLKNGPPREMLYGSTVQFESGGGVAMGPQLSAIAPKKKRWRR